MKMCLKENLRLMIVHLKHEKSDESKTLRDLTLLDNFGAME